MINICYLGKKAGSRTICDWSLKNTRFSKFFYQLFSNSTIHYTKKKFSIKNFFSKCDQIYRKLRIWSHLLKKFLMEIFFYVFYIFCVALFAVMKFSSSEPCQTSAMASFTKTVNGFQPLIIFAQHSILDPSKL